GGEQLALLYGRSVGFPVVALRYFTVYGPRQRPDMAFTRFCRAILAREPLTVYGDGSQSRDFTFVADVVEANLRAGVTAAAQGVGVGFSVVVPAYNEAESLPELTHELTAALDALGGPWEIVFVDDGSRDGTDRVIESLAARDPRVRGVSLRQNCGKSAALAT